MKEIREWIKANRYEVLLGSLLLFMFGHLIIPKMVDATIRPFLMMQFYILGILLFFKRKNLRLFFIILFVILVALETTQYFDNRQMSTWIHIIYVIYFLNISYKIFLAIFKTKEVGRELIAAVFCGFMMLTIIGSFIFLSIEFNSPGSFSNLGDPEFVYRNIQYYSFITTLTIGFGDIVPLTNSARQFTVFLGLVGNFYTVIVTGIVIGKYIQTK